MLHKTAPSNAKQYEQLFLLLPFVLCFFFSLSHFVLSFESESSWVGLSFELSSIRMDGKQGSCDLSTKHTTRMIAMCFKAEEKLWHENNNKMASTNNNVCIHFSNRSFSLCLSLYTRTKARLRSPSKTSILSPTIYGRMDVAAAVARLLCAPNACWQQNNSQQLEESLNKWIAFERRPIRNSKYNLFPFEKESNFYHINTNAHTHTNTF